MPACTWRKLIDVVADMKPASADQVKPSSRNEAQVVLLGHRNGPGQHADLAVADQGVGRDVPDVERNSAGVNLPRSRRHRAGQYNTPAMPATASDWFKKPRRLT